MSCHVLPKPTAKKKVSRKEYSLLEEWAPQTLNAYHCAESPKATLAGPSEALTTPERNPTRRRKTRSSSMYEEWKSQALQSDGPVKPATAPPEGEDKQGLVNKTPVLRGPGGVESVKGRHQRSAEAGVSTGIWYPCRLFGGPRKTRLIVFLRAVARTHPKPTNLTAASTSKEIKSAGLVKPGPQSQKQPSGGGYTSPNGTYVGREELVKLSNGVKIENDDTVYFLPSFVIDPWKGVRVMKTECLRRY
ncbi:hypothetical protein BO71DRAFT_487919 [Aspergillus terreus]|uniref:Uncharacterized protein n=1 Tax=Aspergillus terreus TaxID=33178 RepID=A0A5M3YZP3_ASPTE|nr:hypothetical protein ATETN484_0006058600 [Aspergillus terreus]GFF20182.1 hypothetical protein BO71DRAFT_487919 [Aspergillus terreus]